MAGYTSKEEMEVVVARWIEKLKTDENLAKLSKEIEARIGYDIYDLELHFHTDFMNGVIDGGIGIADPPPTLNLEMSSEIFDGMFTGEVDAASATMTGEMTFSGDMNAAMGLQVLGDDMGRTYLEAKSEVLV
jgi:putative sterol carrier protein